MIHGILNVYKEKGYTSHDVVAKLRGIAGQKKIGHTGTLDPEAVGVLPVCLGRATKLCGMLTDKDKCYETVLLLGIETDTQDTTGKILKEEDISGLEEAEVTRVVRSFTGEYEQIPPMYSALKVNGRKLYELAREGRTVERAARRVTVYGIEILEIHLPRVRMRVHCSKGTYIRTLCHDMGKRLGCCGCMEELIRTRVSGFRIEDSLSISRLEEMGRNGTLSEAVLPIDQMFPDYQKLTVRKSWEKAALNGNRIPAEGICERLIPKDGERIRLYDHTGALIGIYRYEAEQREYGLIKMFYVRERD